jgi:DNA-binding XRE family transcriptional regulator
MQGQGNGRAFARERRALGRAVKETRARRGISQEELGYRATLHRNYVGAMERGELNPTLRTLLEEDREPRARRQPALHALQNFGRVHQTLKCAPAQAAGVADKRWTLTDIAGLLD